MKRIVLASTSPRRKELLESLGLIFDIVSPSYDEKLTGKKFSYEEIENIALNKALSVKETLVEKSIIISADTVVILEEEVLGKPKDREDAVMMLKNLQGKVHKVVTSVVVIDTEVDKTIIESATTKVNFSSLNQVEIERYVDEMNPLDKAGAYGIQDVPDGFITGFEGEYDNVMGFPTKTLIKMLNLLNNL